MSENISNETLKLTVKKATVSDKNLPKIKHVNLLTHCFTIGHGCSRCDELHNYTIVRSILKRSRNDDDNVSLKSLMVLHHLMMVPETRCMNYVGRSFLNFSFKSSFKKPTRPTITRRYGRYLDGLAHNSVKYAIDFQSTNKDRMTSKFQQMTKGALFGTISGLQKMGTLIVTLDLPSHYCKNVLHREINRMVALNLISIMNCYTEAILKVMDRIEYVSLDVANVLQNYSDLAISLGLMYEYFTHFLDDRTRDVRKLTILDKDTIQAMVMQKKTGNPSPSRQTAAVIVPVTNLVDVSLDFERNILDPAPDPVAAVAADLSIMSLERFAFNGPFSVQNPISTSWPSTKQVPQTDLFGMTEFFS